MAPRTLTRIPAQNGRGPVWANPRHVEATLLDDLFPKITVRHARRQDYARRMARGCRRLK